MIEGDDEGIFVSLGVIHFRLNLKHIQKLRKQNT